MRSFAIGRRGFLQAASTAALSFIPGLSKWDSVIFNPWLKKRVVFVFSPNGMVREGFWPQTEGPGFEMDSVLKPLTELRDHTLVVHGICNKIRGDGDNHMRGMSCLLTANELFPGNIQGGSDSPAGWAKGISIDQEIKKHLQANESTRTRFGSLEFGVRVPQIANPWTRMCYGGPNQPIAPVSDPYQMYSKMYGQLEERENLLNVLGLLGEDIERSAARMPLADREVLNSHAGLVRAMDRDLRRDDRSDLSVAPIKLPANVADGDENMPQIAKMQMDLLVNGFENDLNRVATLQFSISVGNAKMRWLDVNEGHHSLSHEPDKNEDAQEKLTRINTWYCEQVAYLANELKNRREPGTNQTMLDNTLIVWTNELGHGSSHSLRNLPMVLVGGGFGFEMGRFVKVNRIPTARLWLSIAHAMGHRIEKFGHPDKQEGGPLAL